MIPKLRAADLLKEDHPYHAGFRKWLVDRKEALNEKSAQFNKRKARLYLSQNNGHLRRIWPSVWEHHNRIRKAA